MTRGKPHDAQMDQVLNVGLFVFHSAWIAFTCFGWVWKRTRPWQLTIVALTALSWVVLGLRFGWGYCPLTDWHWQVRARLGYDDPPSYIQLLIREIAGVEIRTTVADAIAVIVLACAAALGALQTRRGRRSKRLRTATNRHGMQGR